MGCAHCFRFAGHLYQPKVHDITYHLYPVRVHKIVGRVLIKILATINMEILRIPETDDL